jgi:hypothetical protein
LIVTVAVAPYLYGSRLTILLVTSILVAVVAFIVTALVCVASSVSFASDVCMISTQQTKINTFTDKDIEVFPETCVSPMKTQGKKIVVFLARWLGSPETTSQKHPS